MKTLILALVLFVVPMTSANAYLTVTPSSIEFGSVKIGTHASTMFFINNIGMDDVQIQGCNVFGAFHCQLSCFGTLYHGQSCNGTIYFSPRSQHYEMETVIINTSQGTLNLTAHGFGKI